MSDNTITVTSQVEALERRCLAAEARLKRLELSGGMLANIAFNLKQSDRLSAAERACLAAAQEGWDEAKRTR